MADDPTSRLDALSPAKRRLVLERLRQKAAARETCATSALTPVPRPADGEMPLSYSQQQLWVIEQLAPGSPLYNVPVQLAVDGPLVPLQISALAAALARLVERHEILRTRFVRRGGGPRQIVVDPGPMAGLSPGLPVLDLGALPPGRREDEAIRLALAQMRRPFDLTAGLLLRATLLRLSPERHALLLDLHHIVSDGWSVGVLVRELTALYEAGLRGRPARLPELPIQYADYAWHQRQWLQGERLAELLGYWRERLAALPPPLPLPLDRPRPPVRAEAGRSAEMGPAGLPPRLAADLARVGESRGATLFVTLLAALAALLQRLTGESDVVTGTVVANRQRPEVEGLIGYFVNTLVLRTDVSRAPSFLDLLARARETAVGAFAHQELPFEKLVEEMRPERDPSLTPLFQVLFALQEAPPERQEAAGLAFAPLVSEGPGTAKFDLSLYGVATPPGNEGLRLSAQYATSVFDVATIDRLLGQYATLLAAVAADPAAPVSRLPLLSPAERDQMLHAWNPRPVEAPGFLLHERFREIAVARPDAVALTFEDAALTYGELAARAGRLARRLRARGVGPDRRAGVCLERSLELVPALLAVLQAGGAYVPLDPAYPEERLAFLAEDADLAVVVTTAAVAGALPAGLPRLLLEEDEEEGTPAAVAPVRPEPSNLAYVIYTSGSTGRPKGVQIPHAAVARLLTATDPWFAFGSGDVWSLFHSFAFDFSVWEIWGALLHGGRLAVVPYWTSRSPDAFLELLLREEVTVLNQTPSSFRQILRAAESRDLPAGAFALREVVFGGEALDFRTLALWFERYGDRVPRLVNMYGITETTVHVTWRPLARKDTKGMNEIANHAVSISGEWGEGGLLGVPIPDLQLYLLDRGQEPVPLGVPGEIWVGGAGLARGYLGRPELTAEHFQPNPWSGRPGERLYRSGDLAKRRADGELEFLGRADHQVKIRGFRIELGEIEAVLHAVPGVREAVVLVREEGAGDRRLIAYAVAAPGVALDGRAVRQRLQATLPEHVVPFTVVPLDALPLTSHGKVDRRALLALAPAAAAPAAALRTATEEAVAAVWRAVLGVPAVGPDDNFFDLGGHSLLLVEVHERLAETYAGLTVVDLFRFPTVASLAASLDQRAPAFAAVSAAPALESAPPPLRTGVPARDDIAIIGMALRFPGARDAEQFWENLVLGVESVRFLTPEELVSADVDPDLASSPLYVPAVAVCDEFDLFDAPFFGMSPREAESTDPQHRLFLECAWQTLEDAGYDPAHYRGRIGVYGGAGLSGYEWNLFSQEDVDQLGIQAKVSIDKDFLATRVSYKLGLTGPSLTVQTACSTALVAVHLACRALLDGECEMALAGGVSLHVAGSPGYTYEEGGILSPDGHCRAFDAAARGTVPGQGAGIVLLKRLVDALADGDAIDAVIKGSAINNDGSLKVGYTAPAVDGQAQVIRAALDAAGVEPWTISYIEAHGTGTPLGDPIEVTALRQAFGDVGESRCGLGSVKSNVGHLDTAAGIAGLIKTTLALQHRILPPSLHFERPNPQIAFAGSPFHVVAAATPWTVAEGPRRAGVSSFGIGGTNAHVIVEEAPAPHETVQPAAALGWHLLVLSARSAAALDQATAGLAAWLERHPDLDPADVAWTLQAGRRPFDHRRAVLCRDLAEARTALLGQAPRRVLTGVAADRPVAFLFPGQGAQRLEMARGIYTAYPAFRRELDHAAEILRPHLDLDLRELLFPPPERRQAAAARLDETRFTQPALFAVEHALARLWMSWGIEPWALLGHSIGEYVAACLAGVFSLEDALALVTLRGRLVQELPPGAMLGVPLPAGEVEPLLGAKLSLAAVNAADRSVVAGPAAAVEELRRRLAGRGIEGRPLATSHAFHSAMMEPAVDALAQAVAAVTRRPPRLPWLSNVTGHWISPQEATDPAYWGRHLRAPVRFADGVGELLARPGVLLEVGPGETLVRLARRELQRRPGGDPPLLLSTLPPAPEPGVAVSEEPLAEEAHLLRAAGRLWLTGARLDWRAVQAGRSRRRVHLPTYPFERRRYWLEARLPGHDDAKKGRSAGEREKERPTAGKVADPAGWFYLPSWKRSLPPRPPTRRRDGAEGEAGTVLVFLDEEGLGDGIVSWLRAAGRNVVTVTPGAVPAGLTGLGDGAYALRPGKAADYAALLDALPAGGRDISLVLHLWSFGHPRTNGAGGAAADRSFYSPLFLAQALERRRTDGRRLDLWLVSSHLHDVSGNDLVVPERALLLGPSKVIPLELPGVVCHSLDLEPAGPEPGRIDRAVERLWAEVAARPAEAEPAVIAWRGRQRWLQSFEPVRLEDGEEKAPRLRPGGVYLLTGGLGGVGHAVARWLAQTVGAKLVLVGRTPMPPRSEWDGLLTANDPASERLLRRLRRLRDLEAAGAEVLVAEADVADAAALARVREQAVERWGAVHGVIHAAGVPGGGVISRKDRETAGSVLAPKVEGTLALAAVFPPEEMDLFVLCSSLNSVIGAYGQVDYCAANAFLDAFAACRPGHVVSISWDLWEEAGMAVETAGPRGAWRQEADEGVAVDHPLLDRRVPAGPGEDAYLTRFTPGRHWVLTEHRIQGMPVLPGTAYLELVRAAFEQSTGSVAAEIRQANFVVPLAIPDGEERDVYTVLRRQGDAWSFRVASRFEDGDTPRWQEHAVGEIAPLTPEEGEAVPRLPELLVALPLSALPPEATGAVMEFGPRWGNLEGAAMANGRFLARLRLPAGFASDLAALALHPALLDRATGFASALEPAAGKVYMPFGYTGLRLARPLPADLYSFVEKKSATGDELHFAVTLLDPEGGLLARIDDFAFRRVDPRLAGAASARAVQPPQEAVPVASPARYERKGEGLASAEGVEALRRILEGAAVPHLVVSVRDLPARLAEAAALTSDRILAELDRAGRAPAGPRHGRPELAVAYEAPRNETERWLAETWGDLLGIDAVGIHDDFFELGGDSVLSLRIVARARERGLVLTPGGLFERPTIAALAVDLDTAAPVPVAATPEPAPEPVPVPGTVYAPTDFPDADVSQRDLAALLAQLGGG